MKLESALKHFNPRAQASAESPGMTVSAALNSSDVMAAIGMCPAKASFGMHAYFGKVGISQQDGEQAVKYLLVYASQTVPVLIRKAAEDKLSQCLEVLANCAYKDYARSAADSFVCPDCKGGGVINAFNNVMTHPGCGKTPPKYQRQRVENQCVSCRGKGRVSARCRCGGTGKVRDLKRSKPGVLVEKDCERCGGRGMTRKPSSVALQAIRPLLPDLNERTWRRNWKPFYESLVSKCEFEERAADLAFRQVTR